MKTYAEIQADIRLALATAGAEPLTRTQLEAVSLHVGRHAELMADSLPYLEAQLAAQGEAPDLRLVRLQHAAVELIGR